MEGGADPTNPMNPIITIYGRGGRQREMDGGYTNMRIDAKFPCGSNGATRDLLSSCQPIILGWIAGFL